MTANDRSHEPKSPPMSLPELEARMTRDTPGPTTSAADDPGVAQIAEWLVRARAGEREALDSIVAEFYAELRRMAGGMLRREPDGISLQPTDVANAVYLRLAGSRGLDFADRACFLGLAATAMRHFLADYARARRRAKRGGGVALLPLDEALAVASRRNLDVEALNEALEVLHGLNERHARVVEQRLFAGMTIEESAAALGVSPATIKRDFEFATRWLRRRLREADDA